MHFLILFSELLQCIVTWYHQMYSIVQNIHCVKKLDQLFEIGVISFYLKCMLGLIENVIPIFFCSKITLNPHKQLQYATTTLTLEIFCIFSMNTMIIRGSHFNETSGFSSNIMYVFIHRVPIIYTSLMTDLHQDINRVPSISWCLDRTFP